VLSLLIVLPFISILLLNLPFTKNLHRVAFGWALFLFIGQAILACFLPLAKVFQFFNMPGYLFQFNLGFDSLSILMLLCIGIVSAAALMVGAQLIKEDNRRFNFINLLLFTFIGTNGVVLVNDIFSLYIFIEITAVSSYVLIAFDKDLKALSAVFKYIILSIIASVFMLLAIAMLLAFAADTNFKVINQAIGISGQHSFLIIFAIGLFLCGLFIKAGVMPFHGWLPDTYTHAPAFTSVLLAGITTKVLGVYTVIRIVSSVFVADTSINSILLLVGAVSIILGALLALGQNDFKRMLSYSSISQVGYIILGLGSGTSLGLAASAFHLFNHAIFKALLFINSAALETQLGTRDMQKMGGLSKNMPVTSLTCALSSLSAAGLPPLAGFWSKLMIIIALWLSGHYLYAALAAVAGVLTLGYFLYMQRLVFFGKPRLDLADIKEANLGFSITQIGLAAIIIAAGVFFPFILNRFIMPLVHIR
jgi:multicomponent Na+:H+ antiporter subunit D